MEQQIECGTRVKVIVSSKPSLFEQRLNDILKLLEEKRYSICDVSTNISCSSRDDYKLLGTIRYTIKES